MEGRAVAYERLKEYGKAQEDARAMMALSPTSHKGYLRLGKIFRLQKRFDDALRIYNMGFKRTSHPEFQKQIEATKLGQTCKNFCAACDIFTLLSFEILELIIKFLDKKSRARLFMTSKESFSFWQSDHHPSYWCKYEAHLELSRIHNLRSINNIITSVGSRPIRKLACSSQGSWNIIVAKLLARNQLVNIEHLRLEGINLGVDLVEENHLPRNLKSLKLLKCTIDFKVLEGIIGKCKFLKKLYCRQCFIEGVHPTNGIYKLEFSQPFERTILLEFGNIPDAIFLRNVKNLRSLVLFPCKIPSELVAKVWEGPSSGTAFWADGPWIKRCINPPCDNFINLSHVNDIMIFGDTYPINSLNKILKHTPRLKSLHLLCTGVNIQELTSSLLPNLPNLVEIGIHSLSKTSNSLQVVVNPRKLVEDLMIGGRKKVLCLPFLEMLSSDRQKGLALLVPNCRIIFDPETSLSIANRFWKLSRGGI